MVSQDSSPNPTSSIFHQFMISESLTSENQFQIPQFDPYGTDFRGSSEYPQSLGVLPTIHSLQVRVSGSIDLVHAPPIAEASEINHGRHFMNEHNQQTQRLSLSLGSRMLVPSVQFGQRPTNSSLIVPTGSAFASSSTSYGTESLAISVGNSKFLKPAQSLLEESVKIGGKAIDISNEKYIRSLSPNSKRGSLGLSSQLKAELCNSGLSAEKHELHVKLSKLIALLEEVERRYEHYHHHVEELVCSFEVIAGVNSGKSYTALALQAMSRHFCSLRDAILSQINETRREFSQDMPKISTGLSQLSLFDRENRHNRISLQQLALIQSPRQQWRPIRGLPDTSVAILRSWLFEHFLHPYPNDSEKLMLASQTGLSKNQVERRYEHYHHHVEELVCSFEVIAGVNSGKSYTALALQAMSRHFCSLRDAILSQINETRREFSQDMPKISTGLSQLSLFDRENRHNRISLQQLALIQSPRQQWRPIRGLPDTSVAILRSWLFEHFLHPYPNDSEKLMLASQTGLSKNQVSNWFINARVRLWKPMIEEMYNEEFADSLVDSNP
ncbi:unnamed protein product [Ilex paraguariensis]|uniref:Homeobox domain-containing protein n=1 Tax=Ilex paraguariensis TaxID=185542 RepID=A0ABC8UE77_9AQUA